ncbi:pleckstrin y domain containing, D (with coiled-coil domains) member 1 [Chamberlinius hualienensis]
MSEYGEDSFNITTKLQHCGVLLKRPFGHQSHKWSKRFFVIKEGFLLYYPENERKGFEKRGHLNIHPKGVIPLGGCTIDPVCDNNQEYAIHIKSNEFNNGFVAIAADNHYEREKWLQMLQEASRITWKNTQLGESLIRQLEHQGLQLCREKQDYFDKLQEEVTALRIEIDKNEELERVASELDDERRKLEAMMIELKTEHDSIRKEYESTLSALNNVNEEKLHLTESTTELQEALKELEEEKNTILKEMSATEAENSKLSESQDSLKNMLKTIEEDTKLLLEEKEEVENRCKTNEIHAQILSEEKKLISDHALTLESSMQDLLTQKVLTETELKEEILARIDAEKRLKNAEEALHHLENVIKTGGHSNMNIVREEIMPDVRRLKKFFEDVAEEAKIDAHKPIIMKNAVLARKRYMQLARTQTLYNQRSEKVKSLGITLDCPEPCGRGLHRSLSTIVTNREHKLGNRPTSSLLRSLSTRNAKTSRQLKDGYNFPTTNSETHVNSINIDGNEVTLRRQLSVVKE